MDLLLTSTRSANRAAPATLGYQFTTHCPSIRLHASKPLGMKAVGRLARILADQPIAVSPALLLDIDGEGPRPDIGILDRVAGLHRDPHRVLASADSRHPFERMGRAAIGFVVAESQGVGEPRRLHLGCVNEGPHET